MRLEISCVQVVSRKYSVPVSGLAGLRGIKRLSANTYWSSKVRIYNAIVEVYRKRRNVAIESIERYFPDTIKFTRPEGGLFTWIELPEGISARDVLVRSLEKKIAFVPGGSFYPNGNKENTLRINYSNMPEDKIEKGLKTLGEVVKEYISQSK